MKVHSMTGFGRAWGRLSDRVSAGVMVRSVNNRHLDIQVRIGGREESPEAVAAVRDLVTSRVRRGRVGVQLNLERTEAAGAKVLVDGPAIRGLLEQLRELDLPPDMCQPVALGDVLSVPGLVAVETGEAVLDEQELSRLKELVDEAVSELVAMRAREGEVTLAHLEEELQALEEFVAWLEPQAGVVREKLQERLRTRLEELLGPESVDEGRMLQEVAMLADRADVAEEIVRLKGHLEQFRRRLREGGVVGRALDFLCQEINRELNTLGSKMREALLTERLVDAKSAVERIREQVQNLE
ncbi:MAG: YicC family protein [Acidobacteria bacterium]|nr:YicC family protein [Acidobacteriota bacterium]